MIYMLTRRFKIELCRPFGACIEEGIPLIRRVSPYANLFRPFGAFVLQTRDKESSPYTQKNEVYSS